MVKNGAKGSPNTKTPKNTRPIHSSLYAHAVQCETCFKWRTVSKEEFEEIRFKALDEPFICNKKPKVSCDDPADLEYDSSRTWVMDKPNIPKTPAGFQREMVLRKDFSKLDVHYVAPDGKKIRSSTEIMKLVEDHPEYNLSLSDFSFASPKVMSDTIPEFIEKNGTASGAKRLKTSGDDA